MIHKMVCDSYSDFYDTQQGLCVIDAMQKGFARSNLLYYMIRSAEVYPDEQIVSALKRQLSLTHFRKIIHIKDDKLRSLILAPAFISFYAWLIDSNVITGILRRMAVS